jgi:hypothetical protein
MTSPETKVEALVASGRISGTDADKLRRALHRSPTPHWSRLLWAPFDRLALPAALAIGAASLAVQALLSRFGVRFDGAFDVHVGAAAPGWGTVALELVVAWPLTALVVWLACLAFSRKTRLVDAAVAVAVARAPLTLCGALAAVLPLRPPVDGAPEQLAPLQLVLALLLMPLVIWFLVIVFQGIKTATGLAGGRLWATWGLGLTAAEVVSKVLLHFAG